MKKAQYIIINTEGSFFVEITRQNKILFSKDSEEATKMNYSDTEELIPLIELYSGSICIAEPR